MASSANGSGHCRILAIRRVCLEGGGVGWGEVGPSADYHESEGEVKATFKETPAVHQTQIVCRMNCIFGA